MRLIVHAPCFLYIPPGSEAAWYALFMLFLVIILPITGVVILWRWGARVLRELHTIRKSVEAIRTREDDQVRKW